MSRTLFWYVFRDLLRIFLMASGALAGIMSFGGLLRPLTQNGLDGYQVLLLLRYSMPAMSTYSLPVAALFATTVVYGRMSADNELTACRASGISFLSMSMPAMLLGLLVSLGSMFLLCFTVPQATLKIEQVVVSNLAQVIAHQIEATHEIHFNDGQINIFAEKAILPQADPARPNDAQVQLIAPMICSYVVPPGHDRWFQVPRQFYTARIATAYIHENPADASATLRAVLADGVIFPRRFTGPKTQQGGMAAAEFGPQPIPSRLEEKAKFMDIFQLKNLEKDPFHGQEVQHVTAEFIREDQALSCTQRLIEALNSPGDQCVIRSGNDTYTLRRGAARVTSATSQKNQIILAASPAQEPVVFTLSSGPPGATAVTRLRVQSRNVRLTVEADTPADAMQLNFDFDDALVDNGDAADVASAQARFTRHVTASMPPDIAAYKTRTAQQYLDSNVRNANARQRLLFAVVDLINHLQAEMHARAAFVVSCLLLVMVGAALGMMFRSGNFLNAFAVSVVPAMFSTILIVSGQHVAQATPINDTLRANPLHTGLTMIWASNVLIGVVAVGLLTRLQRQ
jgi:lipopolysaccharide export LptBFGC system permease protein LptF